MIFHNAQSMLNQLSEEQLAEVGIILLEDGTVKGLPKFPFEYPEELLDEPVDDSEYRGAVPCKDAGRNHIPSLMENINRARHR